MGRLIDVSELYNVVMLNKSDWGIFATPIDQFVESLVSQVSTVEAIPKADYENRLKADMVAMLEDLRFQAEENIENIYEKDEDNILMLAQHNAFADCFAQYNSLIEERIDALKGRSTSWQNQQICQ